VLLTFKKEFVMSFKTLSVLVLSMGLLSSCTKGCNKDKSASLQNDQTAELSESTTAETVVATEQATDSPSVANTAK